MPTGVYVRRTTPVAERLWPRVEKSDGCWRWTGNRSGGSRRPIETRYGLISVDGKDKLVHRVAYELLVGPIPAGLELDHLCRNTWCVNPCHLEPVTHAENIRRGVTAQRTHCLNGHGESLVRTSHGRICRECRREANVAYRRRLGGGDPSEGSRRMWASRSPEQRREISRKIWETRRRNASAA